MKVEILESSFNPWQILSDYQEKTLKSGKFGAVSAFVGTMRDFNDGEDDEVQSLFLEHYPAMADDYLQKLALKAKENYAIQDILLMHRVGIIRPGDSIVLVAVWSAHRREAYLANREIMEDLKSRAPFWKKECLREKQRWVEYNTPG